MQAIGLKAIERISIALMLIATVSVADAEQVDPRIYGECMVASTIDEFEDEISQHVLYCEGVAGGLFYVSCSAFQNFIAFKPNRYISHFTYEELIDVRYRFDRRSPITKRWFWDDNIQMVGNKITDWTRDNFLRLMRSSKRLIFGIGEIRSTLGKFDFGEATVDAASEFEGRCESHWP